MMKKLLVLSLVLAVCGLANAAMDLSLRVDGADVDSVLPGAYVLSIFDKGAYNGAAMEDVYFALVSSKSAITSGVIGAGAPADSSVYGEAIANGMSPDGVKDGIAGFIGAFSASAVTAGGKYLDANLLGVAGDMVELYSTADFATWTLVDGVSIVPEPMTLGLLSLGALFIRKRK